MSLSVRFCGAARTVTGSCFLFDTGSGRLLVDCGLFQGPKTLKALNYGAFPFRPADIDAVLLTVLLVGFQAHGTLGRFLADGAKAVRIQGEVIKVDARIRRIDEYSGHADGPELARWIAARRPVRRGVFLDTVAGWRPRRSLPSTGTMTCRSSSSISTIASRRRPTTAHAASSCEGCGGCWRRSTEFGSSGSDLPHQSVCRTLGPCWSYGVAAQAGRWAGTRLSSFLLARDVRNGPRSNGARLIVRIIVHILPSGATTCSRSAKLGT